MKAFRLVFHYLNWTFGLLIVTLANMLWLPALQAIALSVGSYVVVYGLGYLIVRMRRRKRARAADGEPKKRRRRRKGSDPTPEAEVAPAAPSAQENWANIKAQVASTSEATAEELPENEPTAEQVDAPEPTAPDVEAAPHPATLPVMPAAQMPTYPYPYPPQQYQPQQYMYPPPAAPDELRGAFSDIRMLLIFIALGQLAILAAIVWASMRAV